MAVAYLNDGFKGATVLANVRIKNASKNCAAVTNREDCNDGFADVVMLQRGVAQIWEVKTISRWIMAALEAVDYVRYANKYGAGSQLDGYRFQLGQILGGPYPFTVTDRPNYMWGGFLPGVIVYGKRETFQKIYGLLGLAIAGAVSVKESVSGDTGGGTLGGTGGGIGVGTGGGTGGGGSKGGSTGGSTGGLTDPRPNPVFPWNFA